MVQTKNASKTDGKQSNVKRPPPQGNVLTRVLFRPRVLVLLAIGVSATVLVPLALPYLPDLRERSEYRLPASEISVVRMPHWVPHDLVDQVVEANALPDELSLLDENLTQDIADSFALHPWVANVLSVRKTFPGRIDVELEFRKPVAMVQVSNGMYPVDASGALLPPTDFSVADTGKFLVIQNVKSTPQGPAGTNWGDVGVVGAARLADVLFAHWKQYGLAAIVVPRQSAADAKPDDFIYELLTTGGSRIVWGRIPDSDYPGELSAEQKIGRLKKYLDDFDSFDHPHGPYEIDIRHWREISRRPITSRERNPIR